MGKKLVLSAILALLSLNAKAIPPDPPYAIYNKIKLIAARNCVTEDGIRVSEFKDTANLKFVLELNDNATAGLLIIMEDGIEVDSLNVTCK